MHRATSWVVLSAILCGLASASMSSVDLEFRLLSAAGEEAIEREFWLRSTPGNKLYRSFLTIPELEQLVTASEATKTAVVNWLASHGASDVEIGTTGDVIFATIKAHHPLAKHAVTSLKSGREVTLEVPTELQNHVTFLFARAQSQPQRSSRSSKKNVKFAGVTENPLTVRKRYKIPNTTLPAAASKISSGVAEFEGEQFYGSNVYEFNKKYGAPNGTVHVLGPNNGGYFGEGNLDIEYLNILAGPSIPVWWIAKNEFSMSRWCQLVLTIKPLPVVLSVSWGSGESGYENTTMIRDSAEFRKLGLLGVSLFAASGDVGTGSTGFFSCGTFDPTWPASSPYVTAVGGTYANGYTENEIGWDDSGGGFSTVFPAPAYQANAIKGYFASEKQLPSQAFWNRGGRGIPDVSSLATNMEVYSSGWGTESGTSAATPSFAGVITRIIAEKKASGDKKYRLGFLNPALYALGKVGYDVVQGNNKNPSCPTGFNAAEGWDPITGLGTPDYEFLSKNL